METASIDSMDIDMINNSPNLTPTNSLVIENRSHSDDTIPLVDAIDIDNDSEEIFEAPTQVLELNLDSDQSSQVSSRNEPQMNSQGGTTKEQNSHGILNTTDDDDGSLCPICLDNWTSTGDHRICSLKCGHLFGYKCVSRWLEAQPKTCPTCKKPVKRSDLRYIYAKKLVAVDTVELETMRQQLEEAVLEKNRVLQDMTRYVAREHVLNQEIQHLNDKIRELTGTKARGNSNNLRLAQSITQKNVRLYMHKSLELCKQNGCRVFDVSGKQDMLIASLKSPNRLWGGFGVEKINMNDFKKLVFIPLHDQQIRDISLHSTKNLSLTASMDKKFKVIDTNQHSVLFVGEYSTPLWSCAWDLNNDNSLYIGTQFGDILKYDMRNMSRATHILSVNGDTSPVVSIASIPSGQQSDLISGGVISCKLDSVWIFENAGETHVRHSLPLEGPFTSMKYESTTKQMLVSSRPNSRTSYCRHTLCNLEKVTDPDSIQCHIIHSYKGGSMQKLLSKSCFVSTDMLSKQYYVAAHVESDRSVFLWSINTGSKISSIPAHDAVLDLKGVTTQSGSFLISLTQKKLEFFRFIQL